MPSGGIVFGGMAEGVPRDRQRLGDVSGVDDRRDGDSHEVPAAAGLRVDLSVAYGRALQRGEPLLEVTAGVSPFAPAAEAGMVMRTL